MRQLKLRLITVTLGGGRVVSVARETKKTTRDEEDLCNDRDEEAGEGEKPAEKAKAKLERKEVVSLD
jgi:hypothetical protein